MIWSGNKTTTIPGRVTADNMPQLGQFSYLRRREGPMCGSCITGHELKCERPDCPCVCRDKPTLREIRVMQEYVYLRTARDSVRRELNALFIEPLDIAYPELIGTCENTNHDFLGPAHYKEPSCIDFVEIIDESLPN